MGMKPQSKRKDFHEKGFPPNLEVFGELLLASSIAVDQWVVAKFLHVQNSFCNFIFSREDNNSK